MAKGSFWIGMGTGVVVGVTVGILAAPGRKPMKTCVGRTMQNVGRRIDSALDGLLHSGK